MPLHLFQSLKESGKVPEDWLPDRDGTIKYPVRNQNVRKYLRTLKAGKWRKVIKLGNFGEVHYFEHESGTVAGVKYFQKQ